MEIKGDNSQILESYRIDSNFDISHLVTGVYNFTLIIEDKVQKKIIRHYNNISLTRTNIVTSNPSTGSSGGGSSGGSSSGRSSSNNILDTESSKSNIDYNDGFIDNSNKLTEETSEMKETNNVKNIETLNSNEKENSDIKLSGNIISNEINGEIPEEIIYEPKENNSMVKNIIAGISIIASLIIGFFIFL